MIKGRREKRASKKKDFGFGWGSDAGAASSIGTVVLSKSFDADSQESRLASRAIRAARLDPGIRAQYARFDQTVQATRERILK